MQRLRDLIGRLTGASSQPQASISTDSADKQPATVHPIRKAETKNLVEAISSYFSANELQTLCFDLGVDYEDLPGTSKTQKARELVQHFSERDMSAFVHHLSKIRPYVPWNELEITTDESPGPPRNVASTKLAQLIDYCFNEQELSDLCFELGVDFDSLPGASKANKARELVALLLRRGRDIQLVQACTQLRPKAPWAESKPGSYEPYSQATLLELWRMMRDRLSESDLAAILAEFKIVYKPQPIVETSSVIREAIAYLARRERLDELVAACAQRHPDIEWQKTLEHRRASSTPTSQPQVNRAELRQTLVTRFTEPQLCDLCFELGINYEDLPGEGKEGKARELIVSLERNKRIHELVEVCSRPESQL